MSDEDSSKADESFQPVSTDDLVEKMKNLPKWSDEYMMAAELIARRAKGGDLDW